MLTLTEPPEKTPETLCDYYRCLSAEGLTFSSPIQNVCYDMCADYDPAWAVDSVVWNAGGEEAYQFADGRRITLKQGGALTIARGERYGYETLTDAPFRTNMIVFSADLTQAVRRNMTLAQILERDERGIEATPTLRTGVASISGAATTIMDDMVTACRNDAAESDWYDERAALLYSLLLRDQKRREKAAAALPAAKASTRRELARRVGLAAAHIHECYDDASLDLNRLSREARLSRYHFIRVFKAVYGQTPMDYLAMVRADAAAKLLADTQMSIMKIATRAGFADRTSFFRQFRRRCGVSPTAYRGQI